MKDIIRSANRIAAYLPDNMVAEWAMILHDTETYKKLSEEDIKEAMAHLQELLDTKENG